MRHGIRNNEGDRIADVTHHVARENGIRRGRERIVRQIEQARQAAEILDIVGGEDRGDARQAARTACIDPEGGMRVGRAQHQRVQC